MMMRACAPEPLLARPLPPRILYAKMPMSFERNVGQTDSRVKFLARGLDYTLFLNPTEAVLSAGESSSLHAIPALRLRRRRIGPIATIQPTCADISTGPAIVIIAIRKGANAAAHLVNWSRPTATAIDTRAVVYCQTIVAAGAAIVSIGL